MKHRTVIVGGGIGGLTAAIALQQAGHAVVVLERVDELTDVGAGIVLQANAMTALEMLGVAEDVAAAGVAVSRAKITTVSGRVLRTLHIPEIPVVGIGIHRATLLRTLSQHAGLNIIRTGAPVVGFEQSLDHIIARLDSGEEVQGDLLIGADGIHSVVRTRHLGYEAPRYCGYTCWRGVTVAPAGFERGEVLEIWGRGMRFGGVHVDERMYWFAPLNAPPGGRDEPGTVKDTLLDLYADWPEAVRETIASTSEDAIMRNDILDRPFCSDWGRGRMTLLGDAAHPMAPDMAQGAGQAIEDAVILAYCLRDAYDAVGALRQYERQRRARTRRFVIGSRWFGRVAQWESDAARLLRDSLVRAIPTSLLRWDVRRNLRFLGPAA